MAELWTCASLELLIAQKIEESFQLDYKSSPALGSSDNKKTDITKDVSAFANSAGGRIIYGMKEFDEEDKKHLPERIDPVDGRVFTREWLDQIICQINPRIDGATIIPVRVGPQDWDTCYVVEIPKGHTAHQARDHRYYRRFNFQSVSMPDHEVRDVMNRRKHPKLELRARLIRTQICTLKIVFNVRNVGKVVPRQYAVIVQLPTSIKGKLYKEDLLGSSINGMNYWEFTVVGEDPVFPGADAYCEFEIPYKIGHPPEPAGDNMICTLYADEMPAVRREILVDSALAGWV